MLLVSNKSLAVGVCLELLRRLAEEHPADNVIPVLEFCPLIRLGRAASPRPKHCAFYSLVELAESRMHVSLAHLVVHPRLRRMGTFPYYRTLITVTVTPYPDKVGTSSLE
jgi:hypothetical protein